MQKLNDYTYTLVSTTLTSGRLSDSIFLPKLHMKGGPYLMKKFLSLALAAIMLLSMANMAIAENNPYAVTEPITIQWWHAHEE